MVRQNIYREFASMALAVIVGIIMLSAPTWAVALDIYCSINASPYVWPTNWYCTLWWKDSGASEYTQQNTYYGGGSFVQDDPIQPGETHAFILIMYGPGHYMNPIATWEKTSTYNNRAIFNTALPAPSNVQASDGGSDSSITIRWNGVAGMLKYLIVWSTNSNINNATDLGQSTTTNYTTTINQHPVPGQVYYFWVRGVVDINYDYLTEYSSPDSGYCGTIAIAPLPPSGVSASDGTYTNQIAISWAAATYATGYQVWRGTNTATNLAARVAGITGNTNYIDSTISAGVSYYYWIKSTNASFTSAFSAYDVGYAQASQPIVDSSRPFSVRLNQSNGFTVVGLEPSSTVTIQSARSLEATGSNIWLDIGNVAVTNFFTTASTNLIASTNQTGFFRLVGTPDTNLTQNLVAYYPLNGDADDISGNENNGVIHGSPSLAASRFGKEGAALSFNGTSYINTGVSLELTNAPISVSLWVYLAASEGRIPFGCWSPSGLTWGDYLVVCSASNNLSFRTFGGTTALATSPIMSTGKWIHIVSVAKSSAPYIHRMYVDTIPYDGTQEGTASSRTNLFIGGGNRMGTNTTPWKGLIDDVRIYNRVLTSNDVWKLYNLIE